MQSVFRDRLYSRRKNREQTIYKQESCRRADSQVKLPVRIDHCTCKSEAGDHCLQQYIKKDNLMPLSRYLRNRYDEQPHYNCIEDRMVIAQRSGACHILHKLLDLIPGIVNKSSRIQKDKRHNPKRQNY